MKSRRKKKACAYFLSCVAVLEAVSGISGCTAKSPAQEIAQAGQSTADTAEKENVGDTGVDIPQQQEESVQVTEADIAKLKAKLEIKRSNYDEQFELAQQYLDMAHEASDMQVEKLMQSEALRCYEENTLLAVELKTLVMGSLGADVPGDFQSDSDADALMSDYADYFLDNVQEGILSGIASEEVRGVLKNGISGALDAFQSGNDLEDILDSAMESAADGVVATVKEAPVKYALNMLDETAGGLAGAATTLLQGGSVQDALDNAGGMLGEIQGIMEYDDVSPADLMNALSESVNTSSQKVASFLEKDHITSDDINSMIYEYTQFGNSLDALNGSGGGGYFDWQPYCGKMEIAYQRYVRNEMMIRMLGEDQKNTENKKQNKNEVETAVPEGIAELAGMEMPALSQGSIQVQGTLQEQAQALEGQIEEYEAAAETFEKMKGVCSRVLAPMDEYRSQVGQIDYKCYAIRDYAVNNFQIQYDEAGSEWVQQNNQLTYGIGQIAKYSPGSWFVGILAACELDNSSRYYQTIVDMCDGINSASRECVVAAKDAIQQLSAHLYFFDDLVDEGHDLARQYQNQCILQRLYEDGSIDIEESLREAKEQLYILGAQMDFLYKLYKSILTNGGQADGYLQQYNEISEVLNKSGIQLSATDISARKWKKYLVPVMEAGENAIIMLNSLTVSMAGRQNGFYRIAQQQGGNGMQEDYCYMNSSLVYLQFPRIFYADGEPLMDGKPAKELRMPTRVLRAWPEVLGSSWLRRITKKLSVNSRKMLIVKNRKRKGISGMKYQNTWKRMLCLLLAVCSILSGIGFNRIEVISAVDEKALYMEYLAKEEKRVQEEALFGEEGQILEYKITDLDYDGKKELLYTFWQGGNRPFGAMCMIQDGEVCEKAVEVCAIFYRVKGAKTKIAVRTLNSGMEYYYDVYTVASSELKKKATYRSLNNGITTSFYKNKKKISGKSFRRFEKGLKEIKLKKYKSQI